MAFFRGIWLDGSGTGIEPETLIANNAIQGGFRLYSVGIDMREAAAYVLHNTIIASSCGFYDMCMDTPPELAVGILFGSRGSVDVSLSEIANNIVIGGESAQEISLYEVVNELHITGPVVSVIANNLLVVDSDDANYCAYADVPSNVLDTPRRCLADPLNYFTLASANGDYAGNILDSEVGLCADGVHIDPSSSPAYDVASLEYPAPEHLDYDGDVRERDGDGTTDIGADHSTDDVCVVIVEP